MTKSNVVHAPKITFKELKLNPSILKALTARNYTHPTPIQALSIPEILAGKDLVASAQTGTGKTAAFVLPALQLLSDQATPQKKPRVLILTPTRELAAQITDAAAAYGKFLQFNIISLVGGMGYPQQIKQLSRQVDIIVATPGRLMDHMERGRVDLSKIEMLVLDEADRMLDMGFIDDVRTIAKATSASRQTLLFSATVNSQLSKIIKTLLKDPATIDFSHEAMAPDRITQTVYWADSIQHKTKLLEHLLQSENIFKAIIFTATKRHADQLAEDLREDGFQAAALHGDLKQAARNRTVEQLRRGKIQYVVATDVAARGIDISDLTHVINYDLPKFSEDYVHRIGRTGRAGKTGIAISFALHSERINLQKIERYLSQKVTEAVIPGLEPSKKHSASAPPKRPSRTSAAGKPGQRRRPEGDSSRSERPSYFDKPRTGYSKARPDRSEAASTDRRSARPYSERSDAASTERRSARPASRSGATSTERRPARPYSERSDTTSADRRPARSSSTRSDASTADRRSTRPSSDRYADKRPASSSDRRPPRASDNRNSARKPTKNNDRFR